MEPFLEPFLHRMHASPCPRQRGCAGDCRVISRTATGGRGRGMHVRVLSAAVTATRCSTRGADVTAAAGYERAVVAVGPVAVCESPPPSRTAEPACRAADYQGGTQVEGEGGRTR